VSDAASLRLASDSAVELARQTWDALGADARVTLARVTAVPPALRLMPSKQDTLDSLVHAGLALVESDWHQPTPWGAMVFLEGAVKRGTAGGAS